MSNRLIPGFSVLLVIGLGISAIGAMRAFSLHSSSARGGNTAATQTSGQDHPVGQQGFIGYAGDVLTYHYSVTRQGQNTLESLLTTSNVNSNTFGKIGFFSADGKVDAQPLYVYRLPGQFHVQNTLFVVTEHGSAYAFDADSGTQSWKVSTLAAGETTSGDHGCSQITPEIGITATPVIDRRQGPNGAMYLVAMSRDSSGNYHQRLHALDLKTGAELFGGPAEIQAKYPGTGDGSQNGFVVFAPGQYAERAGLLELGGVIYIAFTSHCDFRPYTGWVMGYNALTLAQTSVIDVTPNGNEGAIWMAGTGLAGDSGGNIYFLDGNGTFDTTLNSQGFPINGDYGNAFVKLSTSGGLAVADYFNMFNTVQESNRDEDLGSGGAIVLPDLTDNNHQVHHLAVGAGKDSNIYVVNRDNMGKFNPNNDNAIYQELDGVLPGGVWANPAYFNNTVYYGSVGSPLKAFPISNAMLAASPSSQSPTSFGYPGTSPAVSANGASNGIVWAVENSNPAVLHAYDATNLAHELYNSNQAGSRDQFGPGNKFITPVIVNGKVFVGTQTGVAEFGLLQ
jgi:outer membrane protein assembly factor BamB